MKAEDYPLTPTRNKARLEVVARGRNPLATCFLFFQEREITGVWDGTAPDQTVLGGQRLKEKPTPFKLLCLLPQLPTPYIQASLPTGLCCLASPSSSQTLLVPTLSVSSNPQLPETFSCSDDPTYTHTHTKDTLSVGSDYTRCLPAQGGAVKDPEVAVQCVSG